MTSTASGYYVEISHAALARNPETGEWEPLPEGTVVPSIAVGPYPTEAAATTACHDDPVIDAYCCDTRNERFVDDVTVLAAADVPADAEHWKAAAGR